MKKNMKSLQCICNQLLYILTPAQKRGALLTFFFMLIGAGLELLGVSAIYPFLQMMLNADELKEKWYIGWIYDFNPFISTNQVLLVLGIIIMLIFLLKNMIMILGVYIQNTYAAKCQREMSVFMMDTYMKRQYEFFVNTNSAEIIRGFTGDVSGTYQIILNIFTILIELVTIICLGAFLLWTDFQMALAAMLLASICFVSIVIGFKDKMKNAGSQARAAAGLSGKYGNQAIHGIKEITVLGRRTEFVQQYNKAALLQQKAIITNGFISACPDRILEGICISGFMGIICFRIMMGADLIEFIPVLGAFAMAAFKILPSISKVSSRINVLVYYQTSLQSVYDNLQASRKYEEQMNEYIKIHGREDRKTDLKEEYLKFQDVLEIKDISWKYQNTTENVLGKVNLQIHKGEAVAFIGASGAGKTTLADIIMGLLKPQEGTVEMDGIDIFTILGQWTHIIGYVPQTVFLIDDTIRCNVAFGLEKEKISDEKIWEALKQAQLKEFVENLPDGLNTIVGERGIKFSGGQRQRIAIARALYGNPDILVLDEATSALDNETETAVMESIDALQGSKTLIIVAHRLTTIRNCDTIYEIKDGKALRRKKEEIFL